MTTFCDTKYPTESEYNKIFEQYMLSKLTSTNYRYNEMQQCCANLFLLIDDIIECNNVLI